MSNFNDFVKPIDGSLAPKNTTSGSRTTSGSSEDFEGLAIRVFESFAVILFIFLLFCALILHILKPHWILEDGKFKPYKESREYQLKIDYEAYRQEGIQKSQDKLREMGLHDYITPR